MSILANYLLRMSEIRRTGSAVKETSFYGTLENLFNEIGAGLKPKVRCVINLQNRGAGIPDGGFFTPNQFQKQSHELVKGSLPERGSLEIKSTADNVEKIAESEQVAKYLKTYRQVLVTNYRDFLLVVLDENGNKQHLESFKLAEDEKDFWQKADVPEETVKLHEARFIEFIKRVMLHAAPIAKPEDVAWFLASYARDAKARIEHSDISALATIRTALEDSLGIKFEGEKGEKFFRSTLVQTLFYGVFSAWVLWHKRNPKTPEKFRWREAVWELRVPMLSVLFEQIATPSNLKNLDLVEVLDWTGNVLNRVVRGEFFQRFSEDHAVQYFYEPFLQAFDPELRKELGVWYTPQEIVKYMVERVNTVLIDELGLPDGLADESVYVLDPACGTGAYLVEVLKRINQTLEEKGEDATRGQKIKRAVQSRIFGFEILPAPFVVSHLQVGLLLEQFGIGLSEEKRERAGVFLTNSLTGWDEHPKTKLPFPEFEEERSRADQVKKEAKILVIIGNPPYNAFAGVSGEEEQGLVEPYKENLIKDWGIKKFNLDDLYVRFFRLAERRIAEKTKKGIVCFISNFSYLRDPSFVVMRQKFLSEFDKIWIDSLNGDSRETGKQTPEGKPDPSIFSTEYNREGIRVGTAIGLLLRKENHGETCEVNFREFWGVNKREELLESLENDLHAHTHAKPEKFNRFSLRPSNVSDAYQSWTRLNDLCEIPPFNGSVERRGFALISIQKEPLSERIRKYFDKEISNEEIRQIHSSLMMTGNRIIGPEAREKILNEFTFDESRIVHYPFKPFDVRFCYLENLRPLFSEPSPQLLQQRFEGNAFLISRDTADKTPEGMPFYFSNLVCDYDCVSGHARHFPLYYKPNLLKKSKKKNENQVGLFGEVQEETRANLSEFARNYLQNLGFTEIDSDAETASLIWYHALAIGYSPEYLNENADGIRQDFPRIPLPSTKEDLISSAELGKRIAALLDTEKQVAGVTVGKIEERLRSVGVAAHLEGKQFTDEDFEVTAGWGHAGKDGVTMPAKGKHNIREAEINGLGETTYDIFINNFAYWRNVPERVWNYYIGGYQVIKKRLNYRENEIFKKTLKLDEITEVTNIIRRIAAIILLENDLNENYQRVKKDFYKI
ncbi:MAG TPA: N-6 DNA methylase [Pyrinomonadaceae bacterium]|nr:N-6 DNA methylase [Pyrinomonadaceae bacterium]